MPTRVHFLSVLVILLLAQSAQAWFIKEFRIDTPKSTGSRSVGVEPVAPVEVRSSRGGSAIITLDARMGAVRFKHKAHQKRIADCLTCHHKGVDSGKCAGCHGSSPSAPKSKDAFHKNCKGCHKKMGGPTGCKGCHKK